MPKKPEILAVGKIAPYYAERLRSAFSCHPIPASPLNDSLSAIAPQIRGIAGTGESVIDQYSRHQNNPSQQTLHPGPCS